MSNVILKVDDIQKYYGNKESITKAVDHISFSIDKGEFVGIMGVVSVLGGDPNDFI